MGTKWIGINLVVRLLRRLSNGRLGVTALSTVAVGCLLAFPSVGAATTPNCGPAFYDPPTAVFSFSPSSPVVGQDAVSFDASSSTPGDKDTPYYNTTDSRCDDTFTNDPITSYHWDFGDGSAVDTTSGAKPTHTYSVAGTHTVTLTVYTAHKSDATTHTVTVSQAATTTSASASKSSTTYGESITFSSQVVASSVSGVPTGTVTFKVDGTSIGDGSVDSSGNASLSTMSIEPGSHTLSVSYNGDTNHSTSSSNRWGLVGFTVNKLGTTTSLGSSATPSTEGDSVTFTATVAGSGAGTPTGSVQFAVDGTNAGGPATLAGGTASYSTSSLSAGSHTVSAAYSGDNHYKNTNGLVTQNVTDEAPTASFTAPSGVAGSPVAFSGSGTDADGSITSYSWSFGDGGNGSGASPSHTYAQPGTYTVKLTVTDSSGQTASDSHQVTISAPAGGSGGSGTGGSGGSGGTGGSGGGGTGGSQSAAAKCLVPNTNGESLASATSALHAAHCNVGKVTTPKHAPKKGAGKNKKWALVVSSESPGAGRAVPNGTKVNLTLSYQKVQTSKKKVHK